MSSLFAIESAIEVVDLAMIQWKINLFGNLDIPSGKHLHNELENHQFELENSRTFYGHGFNTKLLLPAIGGTYHI